MYDQRREKNDFIDEKLKKPFEKKKTIKWKDKERNEVTKKFCWADRKKESLEHCKKI